VTEALPLNIVGYAVTGLDKLYVVYNLNNNNNNYMLLIIQTENAVCQDTFLRAMSWAL
jgi:hypothetical protein